MVVSTNDLFINFPALFIKISTELNLFFMNDTALFIELESELGLYSVHHTKGTTQYKSVAIFGGF